MLVKVVKCSCNEHKGDKFWYHDKVGKIFEINDSQQLTSEGYLFRVDDFHFILPEDCIPLEEHRKSQLDKLV